MTLLYSLVEGGSKHPWNSAPIIAVRRQTTRSLHVHIRVHSVLYYVRCPRYSLCLLVDVFGDRLRFATQILQEP